MDSRTYSVGSSTIKVIFGNIVESRAEVIVSSDDTWISAGGGVSYAINDFRIDDGTGLSMTELEYQQAIASCKPILMFVMDDHAPITPAMVEKDPESFVKLDRFRKTVMTQHSCNLFRTEQDLADRVERALRG